MFLRFSFLALLLALLAGCSKPPYHNLDNAQLAAMLEKGMPIVDIRRPDEWKQTGVIDGSQGLTFVDGNGRVKPDFFPRFTKAFAKDAPVIVICRTGNRTDALARYLVEELGYSQVYNVRDGITRWISDGQPVVRI